MPRYKEDAAVLQDGVKALFSSQTNAAEALFKKCVAKTPDANGKDLRYLGAVLYATIPLMKDVLIVSESSMKTCLDRLKQFETGGYEKAVLANQVAGGLSASLKGIMLCLQGKVVKGFSTMLSIGSSLGAIEADGLKASGDKAILRSASLLVLSIFHIAHSICSSKFMSVPKDVSSIERSREKAVNYLKECWKDSGSLAPVACTLLVMVTTRLKTMLHEKIFDSDLALASEALSWAETNYADAPIFTLLRVEAVALQRDTAKALEIWEGCENKLKDADMHKWLYHYRLGLLALCDLGFQDAAESFQKAFDMIMDDYTDLVPYTACLAMLCYLQIEVEGEEDDKALNMAEEVESHKMKTQLVEYKWGKEDILSFRIYDRYFEEGQPLANSVPGVWALLDIAELMVIYVRITGWMSTKRLQELVGTLEEGMKERETKGELAKDDLARYSLVMTEMNLQLGNYGDALTIYQRGLLLETEITKTKPGAIFGKSFGIMPYLHMLAARAYFQRESFGAEQALQSIKPYGSKYTLQPYVVGSVSALFNEVGVGEGVNLDGLAEAELPAGKSLVLTIPINDYAEESISWTWVCKGYDAAFRVVVEENEERDVRMRVEKSKNHVGELYMKDIPKQCTVYLIWDNQASIFRNKTILYKVGPLPPMLTRWGALPHLE